MSAPAFKSIVISQENNIKEPSALPAVKVIKRDHIIELQNLLQSSLNIETILSTYFNFLQKEISITSIKYKQPNFQINIQIGKLELHQLNYQLTINETNLGHIIFSRLQPFNSSDIEQLEGYIALLIYPLRNCLEHNYALKLALEDPLTGISNRAALLPTLKKEIDLARRHNLPLSILSLDLDRFKHVNDTLGHLAGDTVLKEFAKLLIRTCRESDLAFRAGGEEFFIILRNTSLEGAKILAERLRTKTEITAIMYQKFSIKLTVSIGITEYKPSDTYTSLMDRADKALYHAKNNGRNVVCFN